VKEGLAYTVSGELEGCRLDRFLRKMLPGLAAKSVRYAIEAGAVSVGRERGEKGRLLRTGDLVEVRAIPEREDWLPVPGILPGGSVLYRDASVAVLGKPAGTHTEPQRPGEERTLAGFLLFLSPSVAEISKEPCLTLLARLDYETSGAVPAALTRAGFEFLLSERAKGRIEKTYACLVKGSLEKEMTIAFRLETSGGEKVRVRKDRREENPLHWTSVSPVRPLGGCTLVRAAIAKGKRHQIRAHLAAAGYPILGDRRYGGGEPEGRGPGRMMLHAEEVRFRHPDTGELLRVTDPLPSEFGVI
jgi:23S rRNA pseudouridine1911/1915/1917 synthase